jgi:hypothetical protein
MTYTDGTWIGSATVTYQACWTTNSKSGSFNVDTEGMPRGTVIHFTSGATVNGTNATLATPLPFYYSEKSHNTDFPIPYNGKWWFANPFVFMSLRI